MNDAVTPEPWRALARHTPARIGLGRAGVSLPTAAHLDFQRAHAEARDAVHRPFDADAVQAGIAALGLATLRLHSAAPDRASYLKRPDLGRRLDEASCALLRELPAPEQPPDLALVIADGLSTLAAERHAAALIAALRGSLRRGWRFAPVAVVEQARVAIGDEIGHALGARIVVIVIGERPGLSSPDSLGLYLTWAPRPGRSDAERNCISNVRPEGLPVEAAASRLAWLLDEARRRRLSGVELKDESEPPVPPLDLQASFLLGG
ncbi:ethanolamine ammonia-lyase subunit EutC [Rubrivivax gelatinosus]|uniref:Ethanolamine ammonia-lyase small subunit n=1 Tax=Rubrivivax gelatinosus TaxID=28068 RepID=A0A4R2MNG8_RUBGE|nr:ethanolamine ammonia-lyase subunit EutC [Rubrivivax gelatinosus]MBK1686614.1 ethanolamine ammonia-lyase [Rubrivivax gelatinosus]TCP00853.1 ethanolamine ammonia-lyase light chain [Rubrivivax gelatinosus]